jgi:hypothetical protein
MKNSWLDKYEDGGEYLGTTNVGRNYSPAWGGQFAMGGSIPGSVGSTYARTQGIPSEGKYAKKTLPSAQNGHEMSFYQNGLDWTPKNISKNGSVIKDDRWKRDITPVYQQGGNIPKKKFKLKDPREEALTKRDNIQEFKPNDKLKPLTEAEKKARILAEQKERQGEIREHIPQSKLSRAKEIAFNPLTAFGYSVRNESLPENFSRGERNAMDYAIDLINPFQYVEDTKNVLQGTYEGDLGQVGEGLLGIAPLGLEAKNIYKGFKNIPTSVAPELKQGLQTAGITSSFKSGVKKGGQFITDAMNTKIGPEFTKRILPDNIEPFTKDYDYGKIVGFKKVGSEDYYDDVLGYLNLNKRTNTVYNPTTSMYENATPEWFKPGMIEVKPIMQGHQMQDALYQLGIDEAKKQGLKGVVSGETLLSPAKTAKAHQRFEREILGSKRTSGVDHDIVALTQHMNPNVVEDFIKKYESLPKYIKQKYSLKEYIQMAGQGLGKLAKTEVKPKTTAAILGVPATGLVGMVGHEIYDYNKTQDELEESFKKPEEERKKTEIWKNGIKNKRNGGIIKDDRGQWAYPGEITEIGSNQITMQGVPYPVLGVSDEGDVQMMYPEEEYKFKGKKVTEYPMARNGKRQEQKSLVNLNQLTNFTNYNKPTVGGWLNKYSS